jgi:hypothetical protein
MKVEAIRHVSTHLADEQRIPEAIRQRERFVGGGRDEASTTEYGSGDHRCCRAKDIDRDDGVRVSVVFGAFGKTVDRYCFHTGCR